MIQYLLVTVAAMTLADRLGPNSQTPSTTTTESSPDQYSIVDQMKNALRNEENKRSNRMVDVTVPDAVPCVLNGKKGECIKRWLCDNNDTNITALIDWRAADFGAGACGDYLMQCCLVQKKEIPAPEIRKGCGWANPRGVGFGFKGHDGETNFAEFPWTVALKQKLGQVVNGPPIYRFLGGGSLIHRQVVLTAAHYVFRNPADAFMVWAGEWDSHSTNEPYPHQERRVQEVVAHPNYNGVSGAYDVALLFLESPVLLEPHIGLACLAPAGTRAPARTRCIATGWGKTSKENINLARILKRVEVPVVDRLQCQSMLQRSRLGLHFILDASIMCAGGEGVDTCKGDGGAPLFCLSSTPDRYVQYGIVSWGIGCNTYPGVYADVGYTRGWIDDAMRSHRFDPSEYSLESYQN